MQRIIFHVDVNSAFLSWEAAKRVREGEQDIRLIPAAIGGDRDKRTGVILAKSIPQKIRRYHRRTCGHGTAQVSGPGSRWGLISDCGERNFKSVHGYMPKVRPSR